MRSAADANADRIGSDRRNIREAEDDRRSPRRLDWAAHAPDGGKEYKKGAA